MRFENEDSRMQLRNALTVLAFLIVALSAPVRADAPAVAPSASAAVALSGPQVGAPAPDFDLGTIDGKRATLASYKGKTLVINVWGTWCPPCREEMPDLIASAPKLMKTGVAFLGVDTTEEAPVVRAFAVAKAVPYPLAVDSDKRFSSAYDISYFPTTFVIDPTGVLRARYIDVLGSKQLFALVDAAQHGKSATIASPLQAKIDAGLAAAPRDFGTDAASVEATAKKDDAAIDTAELELDDSDSATGNSTDLLRTRAEEASLRDAAIAALVNVGTSIKDTSLLPRLNGDAARDREAWNEALSAYDAVLDLDPANEDALGGVAQAAGRLGKYDVEVAAELKLAALPSADAGDLISLARAQAKAGDTAAAGATFGKAIALAQQAADANAAKPKLLRTVASAHLYAGRFESASGDPEHARADYDLALAAAEKLPATDARHDMYVEESQEAIVALSLVHGKPDASVSLVPWTGADLPGSIPNTLKYRLVVSAAPGHNVNLVASDVPARWVASFCSDKVCAPFRVGVVIPESGVKVVEFQLVPPGDKATAPKVKITGADGTQRFSATT